MCHIKTFSHIISGEHCITQGFFQPKHFDEILSACTYLPHQLLLQRILGIILNIKLHFNVGSPLYDYIYVLVHTMLFKMNRFKFFISIFHTAYTITIYISDFSLSFMNQLKFKFVKDNTFWFSWTINSKRNRGKLWSKNNCPLIF